MTPDHGSDTVSGTMPEVIITSSQGQHLTFLAVPGVVRVLLRRPGTERIVIEVQPAEARALATALAHAADEADAT